MKSSHLFIVVAFITASIGACDSSTTPPSPSTPDAVIDGGLSMPRALYPDGCNPIAHELDCLLPYPSDVFLKDGRLRIDGAARMKTMDGEALDIARMESDGFPIYPSILFKTPRPIDDEQLAQLNSTIINAKTKMRVPHIAELYTGDELPSQFIALRPSVRLNEETRYVVAIGPVNDEDGTPMEAPETFKALRDGRPVPMVLTPTQTHYEGEIFPILKAMETDVESLFLAWDFTTRSRDDVAGKMLSMRTSTLEWLENRTMAIHDLTIEDNETGQPARVIRGRFDAPMFTDIDGPGAILQLNAEGRPIHDGVVKVPFRVHVPRKVLERGESAQLLQFGHGFFGSCDEVLSGIQINFAEDRGYAMACVDWVGMTTVDGAHVLTLLATEPEQTFTFIDRVYQAMANQLTFTSVLAALSKKTEAQFGNGTPMWTDNIQFLGISQGHILGGVIAALSPAFTRTVLHVGGGPFSLIMTRSVSFGAFDMMLRTSVDAEDAIKFQALAPTALEHIDPVTYAPMVIQDPLPGNPAKQILLQAALGDAQVPNIASEAHAAALGIPILDPSPRVSILGGQMTPYPARSGLVYFDMGVAPDWADRWEAVSGQNRVHDGLRATPQARDQMDAFWADGVIINPCDGPCVIGP